VPRWRMWMRDQRGAQARWAQMGAACDLPPGGRRWRMQFPDLLCRAGELVQDLGRETRVARRRSARWWRAWPGGGGASRRNWPPADELLVRIWRRAAAGGGGQRDAERCQGPDGASGGARCVARSRVSVAALVLWKRPEGLPLRHPPGARPPTAAYLARARRDCLIPAPNSSGRGMAFSCPRRRAQTPFVWLPTSAGRLRGLARVRARGRWYILLRPVPPAAGWRFAEAWLNTFAAENLAAAPQIGRRRIPGKAPADASVFQVYQPKACRYLPLAGRLGGTTPSNYTDLALRSRTNRPGSAPCLGCGR